MDNEYIEDTICMFLANERNKEIIYHVLNTFIPGYESLAPDYTSPLEKDGEFSSEDEMIQYFADNKEADQTFYWNKYSENPDRIMVGAHFTSDGKLLVSLTLDATDETTNKYYEKLKSLLNAKAGVISYIMLPPYENGKDFGNRYKIE